MPVKEPKGLNACAKLSRRVAVSLWPKAKINGLEVVSKKANPQVITQSEIKK